MHVSVIAPSGAETKYKAIRAISIEWEDHHCGIVEELAYSKDELVLQHINWANPPIRIHPRQWAYFTCRKETV